MNDDRGPMAGSMVDYVAGRLDLIARFLGMLAAAFLALAAYAVRTPNRLRVVRRLEEQGS